MHLEYIGLTDYRWNLGYYRFLLAINTLESDTSNYRPLSPYIIMLVIAGLLIIFAVVSFSYVSNYFSHPLVSIKTRRSSL